MDRTRGNSVVSIKSVIQSVARFRWFIFFLTNLAIFAITIVHSSFSITIVAMIEKDNGHFSPVNNTTFEPLKSSIVHVNWSNVDKSRMLSAAFWGSLVTSLFGGRVCELFGPRRVLSLALLLNGLVTLLFPIISIHSFIGAYFIRIISGICTGIILPSSNVVVSRWSMTSERTIANAVVTSGITFANLISLPLAGILVSGHFLGGWPSVFYLFGGLNLIIAFAWYITVYDTPEDHPYLGSEELQMILKNRSVALGTSVPSPWCKMFTSIPVIAYLIPGLTYGWVLAVVSSQIPSFYSDILDFSYTSNGFFASLPWLVGVCLQLIGSAITDKIRKSGNFSLSIIRKCVTVISLGSCSIGLIAIPLLGKRRIPIVLTLAISKGLGALSIAGTGVNHLDIAPSFAGTLNGFNGVMVSIASLIANEAAAHIVGNNSTQQNWYKYFYISSAVNIAGVILFCLMGSGEVQSWDPSYYKKQKSQNNDEELTSIDHSI